MARLSIAAAWYRLGQDCERNIARMTLAQYDEDDEPLTNGVSRYVRIGLCGGIERLTEHGRITTRQAETMEGEMWRSHNRLGHERTWLVDTPNPRYDAAVRATYCYLLSEFAKTDL